MPFDEPECPSCGEYLEDDADRCGNCGWARVEPDYGDPGDEPLIEDRDCDYWNRIG